MSTAAIIQFVRELPSVKAFPLKRSNRYPISSLFLLPHRAAVYFIIDEAGTVQYVGATKDLRSRWAQHHWRYKFQELANVRIAWVCVGAEFLATVESQFIRKLKPPMNITTQRYPYSA